MHEHDFNWINQIPGLGHYPNHVVMALLVAGLLVVCTFVARLQLNSVMKVLTIIATLFMPMTVLTGMYGMNVPLPHLPGGEDAQFWWVIGIMVVMSIAMLGYFRAKKWI